MLLNVTEKVLGTNENILSGKKCVMSLLYSTIIIVLYYYSIMVLYLINYTQILKIKKNKQNKFSYAM